MSDYLVINNYSAGGKLRISKKAISEIVEKSVANLSGTSLKGRKRGLLTVANPLRIVLGNDGKIKVSVDVILPSEAKVRETCLALQREIATNLSMMIEAVPTVIQVQVASLS